MAKSATAQRLERIEEALATLTAPKSAAPLGVELDDGDDNSNDDAILATLEQLGDGPGAYMRVYKTDAAGKRLYVASYDCIGFDLDGFARKHGGGDYEFVVYAKGQSGVKRRFKFSVDDSIRPVTAAAADAPRRDDFAEKIALQMIVNQGQLMTAMATHTGGGGGSLDAKILDLLTKRDPTADLKNIIELSKTFTDNAGPAGPDTGASFVDLANTALKAFTTPGVLDLLKGQPAPHPQHPNRTPNLNLAGNRAPVPHNARVPGTPTGPSQSSPPPQPGNPAQGNPTAQPAQTTETAPTGPSTGTPPTATEGDLLVELMQRLIADPEPMPLIYAADLLRILGPQALELNLRGKPEGVLADTFCQLAPALEPRREFIDDVEDILRDELDEDAAEGVIGKIEPTPTTTLATAPPPTAPGAA